MSPEQPHRFTSDLHAGPQALNGSSPGEGLSRDVELRCQWCSVALQPGVTLCPTCGSPGVPDPRYTKPKPEPEPELDALTGLYADGDVMNPDVVAPWRDEEPAALSSPSKPARKKMTVQEAESRQMRTIVFAGASVLFCVTLGWLAGPLLAGFIESFTGTPVEDSGDLRPMGAFIGMLGGFFIGGIGGIVIWADR